MSYRDFLRSKLAPPGPCGFDVCDDEIHPGLFPHQRIGARWALKRGRSALLYSTGLGKSRTMAEWARHILARTGGPILVLTPLAVAPQLVEEFARGCVAAEYMKAESRGDFMPGVVVTNYERLKNFTPSRYKAVILDESSIIKNHEGSTRHALTEAFRDTPYKLCCTATPSPNDFIELGTHAEFLGICTRQEMLTTYFIHDGGDTQSWRLKGHAEEAFWRWVCSWGLMIRKPSDLGFDDAGYDLPPMCVYEHIIPGDVRAQNQAAERGDNLSMFVEPAKGLRKQAKARRVSLNKRVKKMVDIVSEDDSEQWVLWCELNDEGDALVRELKHNGFAQVAGKDKDDVKETRLVGFTNGDPHGLITKPSIAGFGLNWQHCARQGFVGVSHSYEETRQAMARLHRFGQRRVVHTHLVLSEEETAVLANVQRKARDADAMADKMIANVRDIIREQIDGLQPKMHYNPTQPMTLPEWL